MGTRSWCQGRSRRIVPPDGGRRSEEPPRCPHGGGARGPAEHGAAAAPRRRTSRRQATLPRARRQLSQPPGPGGPGPSVGPRAARVRVQGWRRPVPVGARVGADPWIRVRSALGSVTVESTSESLLRVTVRLGPGDPGPAARRPGDPAAQRATRLCRACNPPPPPSPSPPAPGFRRMAFLVPQCSRLRVRAWRQ